MTTFTLIMSFLRGQNYYSPFMQKVDFVDNYIAT